MSICKTLCLWLLVPAWVLGQPTQESTSDSIDSELARAIQRASGKQTFMLQYKFAGDDELRWNVEHVETLKTSMNEYSETVSSRTQSHSRWRVISVDSNGQATLVQNIPWIKWWQRSGEQEPIEFDTRSDQQPPDPYANEAKKVGVDFPAISVRTDGKMTKNQGNAGQYDFGAGSFWIPLPNRPVPMGYSWSVPNELMARNDDNSYKRIKTQIEYRLVAINDQIAKIDFMTQVLTPIHSPKVHSQICQQLTRGSVDFDMHQGQIVSKNVNWNEKVIGFHGDNSLTHYLGEYTITRYQPTDTVANPRSSVQVIAKPLQIRTRESEPVFRK